MDDLISRQAVKEWLDKWEGYIDKDMIARMQYRVIDIPSAQPDVPDTNVGDIISRQAAIDIFRRLADDEWNKLPEDVKGCVTPELLHGWAIDEEFNEGVIMSQFLRSYRARAERSREYDLMPASSRRLAEQSRAAIEQKEERHAAD